MRFSYLQVTETQSVLLPGRWGGMLSCDATVGEVGAASFSCVQEACLPRSWRGVPSAAPEVPPHLPCAGGCRSSTLKGPFPREGSRRPHSPPTGCAPRSLSLGSVEWLVWFSFC